MSSSIAQPTFVATGQSLLPPAEPRRNLGAVTSIRFWAALFTLLYHSLAMFGIGFSWRGAEIAFWQGLTCFFVISGFILVYVHPSLPDAQSTARFFVARFARIWPSHFVSFLAFIAAFPFCLNDANVLSNAFFNLTMTQAWTMSKPVYTSFNTPSWSLSVELFFYLAFPFLLLDLKRTWRWKLVLSLVIALSQVALCTLNVLHSLKAFGNSAPALINVDPLSRVFEFVVGMSLAVYFKRPNVLATLSTAKATALEVFALFSVLVCITMPSWWQADQNMLWLEPLRTWVYYCGAAPAYGFLIIMMANARGLISKAFEFRPLVYLGELSFSLYLFHYPVLMFFVLQLPKFVANKNVWLVEVVWFFAALAAAALNYHLVEMPARKAIIKFFDAKIFRRQLSVQKHGA